MPGVLAALGAGCFLSLKVLRWQGRFEAILIGLALAVPLYLLLLTFALQTGVSLGQAAFFAPLPLLPLLWLASRRPDSPRPHFTLSRREKVGLLFAALGVWVVTTAMQIVTVDDDYWLHTPVQGRMLRGVLPPTNPFFPDLVLGGHFARDLLVVSASLLGGRDIFGAQILVTSFCHSLGLIVLYLSLRRGSQALSATAGTAMGWLGANVAHRVGLIDFFQNNGAPTYLILALLVLLFCELWERPGRKLAVTCGAVLGIYASVYETHFGLVVLSVLVLQFRQRREARMATLLALAVAALLALGGGSALSRLTRPAQALDNAVANQSQSVRMSFPKRPFLALRIEQGESDPVSAGYRSGLGPSLLDLFDHKPARFDLRYVRLWSWNVVRMHWAGLWLCPLSLVLLLARRDNAPLFFWLFGVWGFLAPGMVDFGPIHEFEWFRWEFAAGFGLAVALGSALGSWLESGLRGARSLAALALMLLLLCSSGLRTLAGQVRQATELPLPETLGLRFDSRAWLARHSDWLRLAESDRRALDLMALHPQQGRGTLFFTLGPTHPWDILFESTAMGLVDLQALGHQLPPAGEPVGVPPYRIGPAYQEFIANPDRERADELGIRWLLLRGDDLPTERRLAESLRLVFLDALSHDGKRRLLFATGDLLLRPSALLDPKARIERLKLAPIPMGTRTIEANYLGADGRRLRSPAQIPPVPDLELAVPAETAALELYYLGEANSLATRTVTLPPRP